MPNRSPTEKAKRKSAPRAAARLRKAERERKIIGLLNVGASIAEIAASEGVTERRIRQRVHEVLAKQAPTAPAEFVALQVSRLNEALLVAYSAMANQNLEAVDRVVKIVRELDRYQGLAFPAFAHSPDPPRRLARPRPPLALPAREETPDMLAPDPSAPEPAAD